MTAAVQMPAKRVVYQPDIIVRSFFDPHCLRALELWRDGRIELVMNRQLLLRYVKLFGSLGISDFQIRRWISWFTSQEKGVYLGELFLPNLYALQLCDDLAKSAGASHIVGAPNSRRNVAIRKTEGQGSRWTNVNEFLALFDNRIGSSG